MQQNRQKYVLIFKENKMRQKIFISFYGPSGSGKSACYKYAARFFKKNSYKVYRADVAYPLRRIQKYAYKLFDRDTQNPRSENFKQDGLLLGFLAKYFESNLGIHAVNQVKKILALNKTRKLAFINTDCRNNAYDYLRAMGFIFVKLNVNFNILTKRRAKRKDISTFDYESDVEKCEKIKFNYVIENNGSLNNLRDQIFKIVKKIMKPNL